MTTDAVIDAPAPMLGTRTGTVTPLPRRTARLLIVDSEAIVRFGLRQLLAGEQHVVVTGEAATPRDALMIADQCPPDLVILDVELGPRSAGSTWPAAARKAPRVRVLVLTVCGTASQSARCAGLCTVLAGSGDGRSCARCARGCAV